MVVDDEESQQRYFTRGRTTRGRGLRNTTGCVTCRRRHVKCDEKKPICGGCERTKHACVYVPRRPPNRKRSIAGNPADAQENNSDSLCDNTESVRPCATSPGQPVVDDTEPATFPVIANPENQPQPSIISSVVDHGGASPSLDINNDVSLAAIQPVSPTPHTTGRVPTGLTPNESAPTNSSFGANLENATAIWVDLLLQDAAMQEFDFNFDIDSENINIFGPSVVNSPAIGRPAYKPARGGASPATGTCNPYLLERTVGSSDSQDLEKQPWYSKGPLSILPEEHIIFQNFVRHISQWMDFFDPKRPFGSHVPQLAMHNVGLMNAVLALSSRHLSLETKTGDGLVRDPNETLRYYYKTLHYIQEAMQHDSYKTSLELLATCSIVSAYEMLDGSRQDWERHLKGVFCIQRSQLIHGDSGGLKQAVWWAWLCQDVWAAFREKRRPFTFWRPTKTLDELDPYEIAARSVYFFAQVVAFCSHEDTEAGKSDPLARIAAAERLREMLENWRRHLTAEFQPLPSAGSPEHVFEPIWIHPPAFAVAFQAYYCAHILLLLNSPVLGGLEQYTQQRKRLMECVRKVCGIGMTLSDYPSSVMCSQCLYVAGIPLENSNEREVVLKLLRECRARSGWPVKPLSDELTARWEASNTG